MVVNTRSKRENRMSEVGNKKLSKEEFLNELVIKKECSDENEVFLLKF